ncbi:MAG: cardiolipin synthase [Dysgonamonadaceae bacterium]|jgi:cardiolipin synthase|nr:cardiolipin synthase [Dysgonamonadaceae bacterium]
MEIPEILRLILQILYLITAISIVFVVVSENRNPFKTLSWVLLLLFLPVLGIIIYYFFGQDHRKHRMISRKMYKKIKKQSSETLYFEEDSQVIPSYRPLVHLLNKNNNASLFSGNDICIYTSGKEKMNDLYRDIEQAVHHIHIQYYIFLDDEIGTKFQQLLIRKAGEGVIVRIIYDEVANWKVKHAFYESMRQAGIEIYGYLKIRFPILTSRVNYRNHRKIVVIDGKIGYIGGMNIADRYINGRPDGFPWRDTHIRVAGRGVYGMQSAFLMDWHIAGKKMVSSRVYYPDMPRYADSPMQIAMDGPVGHWRNLMQAAIRIVAGANKYVYIQTPYFLPTEDIVHAMQTAALGGVDVRLMMPERSDARLADYAAHSYLKEMMEAGVRVYYYQTGFLHAKLLLADDYITVVGSANMDFRSFEHNFEVNAYIYDEGTAMRMKKIFFQDQQSCIRLTLKLWKNRPVRTKVIESVMRLFAPLM